MPSPTETVPVCGEGTCTYAVCDVVLPVYEMVAPTSLLRVTALPSGEYKVDPSPSVIWLAFSTVDCWYSLSAVPLGMTRVPSFTNASVPFSVVLANVPVPPLGITRVPGLFTVPDGAVKDGELTVTPLGMFSVLLTVRVLMVIEPEVMVNVPPLIKTVLGSVDPTATVMLASSFNVPTLDIVAVDEKVRAASISSTVPAASV